MRTFFGIPIPFLARTDAEYVAAVRRTIALPKQMAIVYGTVAGVCFGSFFLINYLVLDPKTICLSLAGSRDPGRQIGVTMGAFLGFLAMLIVFNIRDAFKSLATRHTERLLVTFYDALNCRRRDTANGSLGQINMEAVKDRNRRQVKKILGMPIFSKKKTDAEYVEAIRNHLRWWKWTILLHGAGACMLLYFLLRFYLLILAMKVPAYSVYLGISLGVSLGLILLAGIFSFECACTRLITYRTGRLLVQYDDELNRRPNQPSQP
ncbi:MAG: hypothetical protein WC708_18320 [Lentisphaeria bacterium]